MRLLVYGTGNPPRDIDPDDELVLECLQDHGLPRDPGLVVAAEYGVVIDEDSWGPVYEVEVWVNV